MYIILKCQIWLAEVPCISILFLLFVLCLLELNFVYDDDYSFTFVSSCQEMLSIYDSMENSGKN